MQARTSTDGPRSRRGAHRAATLFALGLLLGSPIACRREPAPTREARAALNELLDALKHHDDRYLRAHATCIVPTESIHDARIRYIEPLRTVPRSTLDSLSAAYSDAHRRSDSTYAATPDSAVDVEDRFHETRELGRRATAVRAALRAALQSADDVRSDATDPPHADRIEAMRAHVLVRYAGNAVGPAPIDRDVIVRLARAPGGPWVVYAFDLASDPPGPLPF